MKSYDNHISQHMLAGVYPSNTSMISNNEQCSQSSGFQIDDDIQTTNSCSEESVNSIESEQNDEDDLSPNGHGVSRCLQMNNNCQDIHEQYSTVHPAEHFKSQAAVWVLKTKECHKLTTSTMTSIIEDVTSFNQTVLSKVEMAVNSALENAGIPISSIPDLSEIFNVDGIFGRPFQGLETAYLQEKYCKQNCCFVKPTPILLGTVQKWKGDGPNRKYETIKETMIYVPLLSSLEALLNDNLILTLVTQEHVHIDGMLQNYYDGQAFKNNDLFREHKDGIQLILYYDKVEVCNPLGSKRKIHKLGVFYYLIGNLPAKMRSKVHTMQLVAIVKKSYIDKYSMNAVLKPIVQDVKKLETGCTLSLKKDPTVIFGTIAAVSADNPASSALGGFKEGSQAYRFCRQCYITLGEIAHVFHEDQCDIRTPEQHKEECKQLKKDHSLSKEFGINRKSALDKLKYFKVASGALVPDIMHDVLEGVLQYETYSRTYSRETLHRIRHLKQHN
ncbi:uncharacterized protein [Dysidea avara]|uniref:uncharacterized protein n=1 Tax=Dysidea avara TaxID=196820 RepID=UPI003334017F